MTDEEFLDNFDHLLKEHKLFGRVPHCHAMMHHAAADAIFASVDEVEMLDRYSQSCQDIFNLKNRLLESEEMQKTRTVRKTCYISAMHSFAQQLAEKMISEGRAHINDEPVVLAALQSTFDVLKVD